MGKGKKQSSRRKVIRKISKKSKFTFSDNIYRKFNKKNASSR